MSQQKRVRFNIAIDDGVDAGEDGTHGFQTPPGISVFAAASGGDSDNDVASQDLPSGTSSSLLKCNKRTIGPRRPVWTPSPGSLSGWRSRIGPRRPTPPVGAARGVLQEGELMKRSAGPKKPTWEVSDENSMVRDRFAHVSSPVEEYIKSGGTRQATPGTGGQKLMRSQQKPEPSCASAPMRSLRDVSHKNVLQSSPSLLVLRHPRQQEESNPNQS